LVAALGAVVVVVWLVVVEVVVCGCWFMLLAELWLSGVVVLGCALLAMLPDEAEGEAALPVSVPAAAPAVPAVLLAVSWPVPLGQLLEIICTLLTCSTFPLWPLCPLVLLAELLLEALLLLEFAALELPLGVPVTAIWWPTCDCSCESAPCS